MKDKDLIEKFITPGMVEKAPEGFTDKLMTRILFEKSPDEKVTIWRRIRVPAAVFTFALGLIILSIVFSSPSEGLYFAGISKVLNGIALKLPSIEEGVLNNLKIPGILIYIPVGILMLSLFDLGLKRLFHPRD